MQKYKIHLMGCDDTTTIEVELTPEELATVEKISKLAEESSKYGCQPTMEVELC